MRFFLILSLISVFFCGCQRETPPLCRVVTQIDVFCDHNGVPIRRTYRETEKMEAVLLYLRLLDSGKAPDIDPDTVDADVYEITVSLSDNNQHCYRQKDHRYFQRELNGWEQIPAEQASMLYAVMRYYPSDL